jgi:hypothetical protein
LLGFQSILFQSFPVHVHSLFAPLPHSFVDVAVGIAGAAGATVSANIDVITMIHHVPICILLRSIFLGLISLIQ